MPGVLEELWHSRERDRRKNTVLEHRVYRCPTADVDTLEPALGSFETSSVKTSGSATISGAGNGTLTDATKNFVTLGVVKGDIVVLSGGGAGITNGQYTVTFVATTSLALSNDAGAAGAVAYSVSSYDGKIVTRTRALPHRPGFAGQGLIEVWYETPRYDWNITSPGRAAVSVRLLGDSEKMLKDINGDVIEGESSPEGESDGTFWKVTEGSNNILRPKANIAIQTAYNAFDLTTLYALIGKVNSNAMTFLGLGIGTMLMVGAETSRPYVTGIGAIWQITYCFGYDPAGWNGHLKSSQHKRVPVMVATEYADGTLTGKETPVTRLKLIAANQARTCFATADFSQLNGWLSWNI